MVSDDVMCSYMFYGQVVTFILFISSEVIGGSQCEYNGVFDLLIGGCRCLGDRRYRLRFMNDDTRG